MGCKQENSSDIREIGKLNLISIIMPAYKSEQVIARAVRSVLAQDDAGTFELVIAADDGADYAGLLAQAGIDDGRIRHVSTGGSGLGASAARNCALEAASGELIAILDADDVFTPGKLARCREMVVQHGLVSTALQITDAALKPLRTVGVGEDILLLPGAYKFTNISMDSMLAYDRRRADPRYDPSFVCLNDVAFLLELFEVFPACFHIGEPLHIYTKQAQSISNGTGVADKMAAAKARLIAAFAAGSYSFVDVGAAAGLTRFYQASLLAEQDYEAAMAAKPGLLFEDHLEPYLASTSAA